MCFVVNASHNLKRMIFFRSVGNSASDDDHRHHLDDGDESSRNLSCLLNDCETVLIVCCIIHSI